VPFDLLVGVPEDIVLPVGAIVAYGLEWSMEGGPRLAVTAEATAVVMVWKCWRVCRVERSVLEVEVEMSCNGGDGGFYLDAKSYPGQLCRFLL
jgi:hypothetical protein